MATSKKMASKAELSRVSFDGPAAWDAWLAQHHATSDGVWLELAKKATAVASVTYPEALEVALVWGWIDGQKKGLNERAWLQRFTPRRPKSIWSKINRGKVLALIAAGKMQPAGLAEVERAQADGRWEAAYDGARTITVRSLPRGSRSAAPRWRSPHHCG